MKTKLNMVGGSFSHEVCSTAFNKNKYVEWDKGLHESPVSFHIDHGVIDIPVDPSKINYGWLCESSVILPGLVEMILANTDHYKDLYRNIFTYDRRLLVEDPDFFKYSQPPASSWIQNKQIYKKTKLISFIGSNKRMCPGHNYRQQMIKKYENVVDHYGRGFGQRELPSTINTDFGVESGKILGLKDYMFSIAMENGVYDDYYCEKLTDCFSTGTIPIYWGSRSIDKYFDVDGVIFLEDLKDLSDLSEELYQEKSKHIQNNLDLVKNMNTAEDFIYLNYLREDLNI
tara:strand:- start:652 stop:1509 length:858 start_codon:yes stop_codon:yes gene_type:complete